MADEGQVMDRARWVSDQAEGAEVLHVGCGQGLAALLLARAGKSVTGTEPGSSDLTAARRRVAEEDEEVQVRIRLVACRPSKLPFKRNAFDVVVLEGLTERKIDLEAAASEAARVLRPKGRLVVVAPWAGSEGVSEAEGPLTATLEAIAPRVAIDRVNDADDWIGVVGRRRPRASQAAGRLIPIVALQAVERGLERSRRAEREQAGMLADARAEAQRLEGAREAGDDRVFGLSHEVRELRGRERDLQEIVAGRREQTARLEAQRESLLERRRELEQRLEAGEQREAELLRRVEEGEAARREAIADRDRASEAAKELRDRIEAAEQLEAELRRQREEGESARREAIADRDRASGEMEKLRSDLADLEGSRESLSRELEARDKELGRTRAELESERAAHSALSSRMKELQTSPSYRVMRALWRVNAAIRRPFRRSPRMPEVEAPAAAKPEQPVLTTGAADKEPAPAEPVQPAPAKTAPPEAPAPQAAAPKPPSVEVDAERRRWLAEIGPPRDPGELRVAAVLDEMSRACFAPECELITFGPGDWRDQLEERPPHFLFVESTWQGNGGAWQYQVATYTHPDYAGLPNLKALIEWCREREIPTVFWNKEDPVHFDRFSEAAALFDHVLTTDRNCVRRYEALGAARTKTIEALPFAAQPLIHNPLAPATERSEAPCFAGAYYKDRHADRRRSLEMLLDAARPFGLVIYDRRFGSEDKAFGFPERFGPHVKRRLSYEQMLAAYKQHKVFLNVNSVADSPTMFSRRVFELAACDTAVLSTESVGVAAVFGGLVPIVETPEQATEALKRLLEDEEHRRELVVKARRLVFSEHTYRRRLATIAATAGYEVAPEAGEELAVLVLIDDVEQARAVRPLVTAISEQSTLPSEFLIGVGARTSVAGDLQQLTDASDDLRVRVTQQDATASRADRFRELAAIATSPWLAIVHTAHDYGEHHFTDLIACTRFAGADVIGSAALELPSGEVLNPELENRFVDFLHPHSVLAKREVIARRGWPDEMPAAWATLNDWRREGLRYYGGGRESFRPDATLGLPPRQADLSAAAHVDR